MQVKFTDGNGDEQLAELVVLGGATAGDGGYAGVVALDGSFTGSLYTQRQVIADNSTRERLVFDPPIKGANIKIRSTEGEVIAGAGDTDADEGVLFVFGASITAVADAWLDESNIAPRIQLDKKDGVASVYFNGDTISYVDMIGVGATPKLTVTVGGVS